MWQEVRIRVGEKLARPHWKERREEMRERAGVGWGGGGAQGTKAFTPGGRTCQRADLLFLGVVRSEKEIGFGA